MLSMRAGWGAKHWLVGVRVLAWWLSRFVGYNREWDASALQQAVVAGKPLVRISIGAWASTHPHQETDVHRLMSVVGPQRGLSSCAKVEPGGVEEGVLRRRTKASVCTL